MSSTKASNAVLAKARAKFGNRVTDSQLCAMAALSNVESVADYLKSNTVFKESLEESGTTRWRRGNLEAALEKHSLFEFYSLCSFEKKIGSPVFELFMLQIEANEIISFMRFLMAGRPENYSLTLLPYADEMTVISLDKLTQVRTMSELAKYLSGYELYRPLVRVFSNYEEVSLKNIATVETLLDTLIYRKSVKLLEDNFSGKEREELLNLYRMQIEITDIETVYRSRYIFGESSDIAKTLVVGDGSVLSQTKMQKLICTETKDEFAQLLKNTKYGKYIDDRLPETFDFLRQILLESTLHTMRFSSSPAAVMLAYITYLRIERRNIVHIIEGVRYGLGSEKIKKSLIIQGSTEV